MKMQQGFLARVATFLVFTAALVCAVSAQQPSPSPSDAAGAGAATAVDPKVHDAAIRFIAVLGLKEKMSAQIDTLLTQGVESKKSQFPNLRPEFWEEWKRRMKVRLNPDDFVTIVAHVYEKYFTAEEIDQLTDAANQSREGKTPVLADTLKEKFQKNTIAIQSEIIGGTTQLGAKVGGEVGQEIEKEHPEWATSASKPAQ